MFSWRKILTGVSQRPTRKLHISSILQEAVIIDGKQIANEIQKELKATVDTLVQNGNRKPKLVAVLVGNNPASKLYVQRKMKVASLIGIDSSTIVLEEKITQEKLIKEIDHLNKNETIDGIIVQLPLSEHINEHEICQAIAPDKDVDGFHSENIGRLTLNNHTIIPATALGVRELIIKSKIDTFGKNAVIVGRSKHVGLPIALLLHSSGQGNTGALDMTTTICHRHTPKSELTKFTKLADLVVVSTGIPGLITKDMIKPGACVIDVGISKINVGNKYKLVGDVDFENVKQVAGYITPVPGGVGPMTVTMLMKNTISVAMKNYHCKT
ncbi:bifunctional methylenetetrahydrofolate dehydrogenase/cyclohydrolase, mitochondrial isoform X1 [Nomia melanderi]|uniref:bifunctional methylenetetrahydrofolate dehydrogenase/cyclohydrolase, mitochondrial isoform X1 n=1 Tax=Nomia melanderi TaxID=2448451 RepID=UPI001304471C|nr:bifunctional methylenetetrahydrofolate dehydrogenase/cyclohydrolase, mitochondrial isoform X1 [Nomia melanderi]XP_031838496.1 bifunctional methylenetetrahydrofolate dehydrogenase/cyclohydrolase, mitochondrial isoform X1 [Nomia melanderi]XP_031838497.1 bifunctional methylenetetrahydrofolate dehydrogenase/cyclohydrolase, mitochondrial isoform X1 [Nomia melanderi]